MEPLLSKTPPLLDPATRSTTGYRIWAILAGPLNALLVGFFLSSAEQGLYYSFGSMAQLVIYLELGLGFVLQQLVSHEFARLEHSSDGRAVGDPEALERLRSLMRSALRWYAGIALITLLLLPAGGWFFLSSVPGLGDGQVLENHAWQGPWLVLSIWVAISVLWVPCWPLLEGSDKVASLYKFRLRQGIAARLCSWLSLVLGHGLWAPFVERLTQGLQAIAWLGRTQGNLLRSAFRAPQRAAIRWRTHVWPLQWRLALSTAGGFTVFALLIPALLWARGPVEAGRLGMTLALVNAIYTICYGLLQARQPRLSMYAARRDFTSLELLFRSRMQWALGLYLAGGLGLLVLLTAVWPHFDELHSRLLAPRETALLASAMGIRLARDMLNLYARSFKREPFFILEVTQGILAAVLLPWTAHEGGADGMLWAWLGINLALAGPNIRAFLHFRKIHTQR